MLMKRDPVHRELAIQYEAMLKGPLDVSIRNLFNNAWEKTAFMHEPEFVLAEWQVRKATEYRDSVGTACRLGDREWNRFHSEFCSVYNSNTLLQEMIRAAELREARLTGALELGSKNFQIKIATPQMMRDAMKTEFQRFDFCGAVFQITVDKKNLLLYPGLADEFGIEILPPGYDNKKGKAGELFLKYGIGILVLRKDGEWYHFFRNYQIKTLAETTFRREGNKVTFFQHQPDFNGWSYEYRKIYEVVPEESLLRISYSLKNTGAKPIHTDQYNHNYFYYGLKYVDSRYRIDTKFRIVPKRKFTGYETDGRSVYDFRKSGYMFSLEPVAAEKNFAELSHPDFPLSIQMKGDFPLSRFAVSFGADQYISPETFIPLDLPPGKMVKWSRIYQFRKLVK